MEKRPSLLLTRLLVLYNTSVNVNQSGLTSGLVAVPVMATVTDDAPEEDSVRVAVWVPADVGRYATVTTPPAEVSEDVLSEKSEELVPESDIEMLPVRLVPETETDLVSSPPAVALSEREDGDTVIVGVVTGGLKAHIWS